MMRLGLRSVIFLVLSFTAAPAAGAVVVGTAVQLDRGNGQMRVLASGTMKVVTVVARPAVWPPGVTKGSLIRVSGRFLRKAPLLFEAQRISLLPSTGKANDPTGVRSRLFKSRGKGPF